MFSLHCIALLQMLDMSVLPSVQDMQEVLPHLTPKQLADAIWSFAKHNVKPTVEFMDVIASEIHSKLPHFRYVCRPKQALLTGAS